MRWILGLAAILALPGTTAAETVTVNCNRGESINRALGRLDPKVENTVRVRGTCAEYVVIRGFDGLTLKAVPAGAALVAPATPRDPLVGTLVFVDASRSVTIDGLAITAPTTVAGIAIGRGSTDVRLRDLVVTGGSIGLIAFEHSHDLSRPASPRATTGTARWGPTTGSDVPHRATSLFENTTRRAVARGHRRGRDPTSRSTPSPSGTCSAGDPADRHHNGSVDLADFGAYFVRATAIPTSSSRTRSGRASTASS